MSNNKIYWKGHEELNQTPDFVKKANNEFNEELPIESFLGDESLKSSSTTRRDFLKFLGFSVAAATLAACESPVVKTVPYVNKPEEIIPGVANWYATTYYDGHDYGSILVKSREGRPIFIKGNKDYGINKGATTPRMIASLLPLYDMERLQGPMIKGKKEPVSWTDLDNAIKTDLKGISPAKIRVLTNTIISPSTADVLNFRFIPKLNGKEVAALPMNAPVADTTAANNGVPANNIVNEDPAVVAEAAPADLNQHVVYDAVSYNAIREANRLSFGTVANSMPPMGAIPDYDFGKAKVIVSIGADFLANWMLSNEYSVGYLENRKPDNDWMSRHFQFETVLTVTGASADVRVPVKPSQQGLVAAAIYQHLTGKAIAGDIPKEIMDKTKAAADELAKAKGASLVVAGANDVNIQLIVNAINMELNNYSSTINLSNPVMLYQGNDLAVKQLIDEMEKGEVEGIFMYGVNPVYSLPAADAKRFKTALEKMKLSVSFSGYADETASVCKYIAPDHHYLEAWNDYNPKANHYSIAQPLIRPLYNTAAWQESLLVWADLAQRGGRDSRVFFDLMADNWNKYGFNDPNQKEFALFEDYWNTAVHNGSMNYPAAAWVTPTANNGDLAAAGNEVKKMSGGKWEVAFYQKVGMGNGQQANNPWLQELPDPISKVTWDNYVTMNPVDMEAAGYNMIIAQEYPASTVKVKIYGGGEVTLPVYPSPGQAKGTIGIALGYGRGANGEAIGKSAYQVGEYGAYLDEGGKKVTIGKNAFALTSWNGNFISYNALNANVDGDGGTYPLATTQTSHTVMGRDSIVRETTWGVYKTKGTKDEYNPEHEVAYYDEGEVSVKKVDLWKAHPIENVGHRWGMTIDLSTCIGCGNCVVACQVENNVPVVGKDEVRRGREMHWLRLDRYYSSAMNKEIAEEKGIGAISMYGQMENPEENPEVVFMPMLCQHCNHAPCETVCPVLATTHSKEGLNQMTYNRCIGTRYCANNCPYKVRRFNWFNYQDYKKFQAVNPAADDMGRLVLNPDVTVRSRGVMEKCSFCVQRIQEGKLTAKKAGRKLVDGDATTACAEACPTDAIQFGDWNDPESKVRKGSAEERSYQALEEVGVEPNIWYKVKVRNIAAKPKKKAHKAGHKKAEH